MEINNRIEIIEVGPRDGFQSIKEFISTEEKKKIIADCRKLIKQVVSPSKYIKLPIKQEIKLFAIMHLPYSGLELLYKMK